MFKAIALMFKATFFTLLVLVLGNWVKWDGRTISDHVKSTMAAVSGTPDRIYRAEKPVAKSIDHAMDKTMTKIRSWKDRISTGENESQNSAKSGRSTAEIDRISPNERQKLRSIIQELNSPQVSHR